MADKKNWYDDDEEDEKKAELVQKKTFAGASKKANAQDVLLGTSKDELVKLMELMDRVEPLVMSINTLMNQYTAGIELRPPLERIAQLETLIQTLTSMSKPTPSYKFKFQNCQAIYMTYKARWEKLKMDLESGKIKRFAAPKRRSAA